jgi:hypothetical protein
MQGPIWYENTGIASEAGHATPRHSGRAKLAGHNPTPNVVDWNGDGKLDLIIGAEDGFFYYFDGTPKLYRGGARAAVPIGSSHESVRPTSSRVLILKPEALNA